MAEDLEHAAANLRGCIVAASLSPETIALLTGLSEDDAEAFKTQAQTDLMLLQRARLSPTPQDSDK